MTLLEVVVSAAILSGLTLVVMTSMIPLTNTSSEQAAALDMDRVATKVLTELRRELRQSGYDAGTNRFGGVTSFSPVVLGDHTALVTAQQRLWYQPRKDKAAWDPQVIWRLSGTKVQRTMPGTAHTAGVYVDMADQVSNLTFQVDAGDRVCVVTLTLQRTTNRGQTLTRTYVDKIEMMNQ